MNRAYNFGAGPAMLPLEILEEAQSELLNWQGLGVSILEVGHRTEAFIHLLETSENLLRKLLNIPKNYKVLFLGGAARSQFAMVPMNFLRKGEKAGYLVTGLWSSLALQEAQKLKEAYCIASGEANGFLAVPDKKSWQIQENSAYLYYAPNETVNGLRCHMDLGKQASPMPLIADMTSCLLTEPYNIEDYALIFAGAQKNIANAGLTLVILREDMLEKMNDYLPTMFDYRTHVQHQSLYATPPTFNCYMALKMFQWIEKQGGVSVLYAKNQMKSQQLYDYIDSSSFYHCAIPTSDRSLVNVCFSLSDKKLEPLFIEQAEKRGLIGLKGHRAVGGLRASLYNAMPLAGVERLMEFMEDFAHKGQA